MIKCVKLITWLRMVGFTQKHLEKAASEVNFDLNKSYKELTKKDCTELTKVLNKMCRIVPCEAPK